MVAPRAIQTSTSLTTFFFLKKGVFIILLTPKKPLKTFNVAPIKNAVSLKVRGLDTPTPRHWECQRIRVRSKTSPLKSTFKENLPGILLIFKLSRHKKLGNKCSQLHLIFVNVKKSHFFNMIDCVCFIFSKQNRRWAEKVKPGKSRNICTCLKIISQASINLDSSKSYRVIIRFLSPSPLLIKGPILVIYPGRGGNSDIFLTYDEISSKGTGRVNLITTLNLLSKKIFFNFSDLLF